MKTIAATFFDLVRPALDQVEAQMRSSPSQHHPSLDAAIDHLLSSGGKRLRPVLVLLAGGMLDADQEKTITLAAAIEMLHNATLVHDDLIDGSKLRRGFPTLNATWSPGATVLVGDYMFARAAHLASAIGSKELMELFARTLMTIVNGEISQHFGTQAENSRQAYLDRIYAKTASLFEVSTEGAALLSGRGDETVDSMKAFGYYIGIAFQIVDDVLDFVSDQEHIGKPVANDLRQGLITLPTLCYLEATEDDANLHQKLVTQELDSQAIEQLILDIRESGAIQQALNEAAEFISAGTDQLETMPDSPEKEALYELARYIVSRTI